MSPGGDGIRRRIASEVTLLPQPVSPTMPKVSLSWSENERSLTAAKVPRRRLKLTERCLTSRSGVGIIEFRIFDWILDCPLRFVHGNPISFLLFVLSLTVSADTGAGRRRRAGRRPAS